MSYESLRVLITGSTRGIGKAAAAAFLERGVHVATNGRRDQDVVTTISELGTENLIAAPDDPASAAQAHAVVEEPGGLDILVNTAPVF